MPLIRILLVEVMAGLRALIRSALAGEPDFVVVGEARDEVEALLQAGRADVFIMGMSGTTLPPVAERIVDEYPWAGVLAVDLDRGQGLLYRLRPQLSQISDLTPTGLAAAIRRATADLAA